LHNNDCLIFITNIMADQACVHIYALGGCHLPFK
jgi:hypothetical protein